MMGVIHNWTGIEAPKSPIAGRLGEPIVEALAALIYRDRYSDSGRVEKWLDWRYRALREDVEKLGMRICGRSTCGEVIWPEGHYLVVFCARHKDSG